MNVRKIIALLGLTAALLTPALTAQAAEPLAPGTYEVTVGDSLVTLVVAEDGTVDVSAPDGVSVILELDENEQPLDEFSVLVGDGEMHAVDIDVAEDGSYTYALDADDATDETEEATEETDETTEETEDATDETEEAEDATADDVEAEESETDDSDAASDEAEAEDGEAEQAPGQHGRDNARAHGGNAHGYGAEGRGDDAEDEASADDSAEDEASADDSAEDEASADDDSEDDSSGDDASAEVSDAASDEDVRTNKHGKPVGRR